MENLFDKTIEHMNIRFLVYDVFKILFGTSYLLELSLFATSYLRRFSKSTFTAYSTSLMHLPDGVIFVSSANIRGLVVFKHESRSSL